MRSRRSSSPKPRPQRPQSGSTPRRVSAGSWSRRRGWLLGLAGVLTGTLAVSGYLLRPQSPSLPSLSEEAFPLPPLSSSPFLNTRADAHYVGSAACRSCHAVEDASFRRTGMGRSMARVDPASEPPNATFDHPLSQRRYRVLRKDGRLWHGEFLLDGQPDEAILADHPLQYVIGSGHHARTYVTEADGLLVESPLTWYASRQRWGVSPGYDLPDQPGFGRGINARCLFCHAGEVEPIGESTQRFQVREAALSCERCHGPGSLHVARHSAKGEAVTPDDTIVNPAHLSRSLAEAICQQCHLQSAAAVEARGRKPTDFRPGLPLHDFRHDYTAAAQDRSMTVTGHVEQMHRSQCYQRSESLTCTTCHNPHGEPQAQERVAYYRGVCLECHQPESCRVDAQRRQRESPDNDCAHCHMPRTSTDVPHVALTDHRIGVHQKPLAPRGERGGGRGEPVSLSELRPIQDLSDLSEIDRKRSLGLAYAEWSVTQPDAAQLRTYRARAAEALSEVRAAGLRDPAVDVMLVRLGFGVDLLRPYIGSPASATLTAEDRCAALSMHADFCAKQGRFLEAASAIRQVVRWRRVSEDWQLLAYCERSLGNIQQSVEALETAVAIDPRLSEGRKLLVPYYRQRGDLVRANFHQRRLGPTAP